MVGLAAFVLTSVLCGLAPSSLWLVIGRLAQGLAAAVLFPQVFSLIRVVFVEPCRRAIAFSIMGAVLGLACIVGQILGGTVPELAQTIARVSERAVVHGEGTRSRYRQAGLAFETQVGRSCGNRR